MATTKNAQRIDRPPAQQTHKERRERELEDSRRRQPKKQRRNRERVGDTREKKPPRLNRLSRRALVRKAESNFTVAAAQFATGRKIVLATSLLYYPALFSLFAGLFGIIAAIGYAAEKAGEQVLFGAGAIVVPGQTAFEVGWYIGSFINIATLWIGAFVYVVRGIWWPSKSSLTVSFLFALVLSFTTVPMLPIWMAHVTVVYMHKDS